MDSAFLASATLIHFFSIFCLALYGMHRVWLIGAWLRRKLSQTTAQVPPVLCGNIPHVTVQVPLYNEHLVAARIIDSVAQIDWPIDKLEIQILDDSTDETLEIVADRVRRWSGKGLDIKAIFRKNRQGFKAGALKNGMKTAKGEFLAIFDADFIVPQEFLRETIPHFSDTQVGMVQTRWTFLNAENSWLTKLQSLLLAPHFGIEHQVRCAKNLFFNFNGTAGVWRKEAIISAGGWQDDTVTEDLDLSYRAQLNGWRFLYLHDTVVPSELPVSLSDFRTQQERWSKGSIQTARKILPLVFRSNLPIGVKLESAVHLLANFCWLFGFLLTVTLYPVLLNRIGIGIQTVLWVDIPLFLFSGGAIIAYYCIYGLFSKLKVPLISLPLLPILSIGLAPTFALSVISGLLKKGGEFKRTPKFGLTDTISLKKIHHSLKQNFVNPFILNIPLFLYTLLPVFFALERDTWPAIPFLTLFPLGFSIVLGNDLIEFVRNILYKTVLSRKAL